MEIILIIYLTVTFVVMGASLTSYFLTPGFAAFFPKWFIILIGIFSGILWPLTVTHFFFRLRKKNED